MEDPEPVDPAHEFPSDVVHPPVRPPGPLLYPVHGPPLPSVSEVGGYVCRVDMVLEGMVRQVNVPDLVPLSTRPPGILEYPNVTNRHRGGTFGSVGTGVGHGVQTGGVGSEWGSGGWNDSTDGSAFVTLKTVWEVQ